MRRYSARCHRSDRVFLDAVSRYFMNSTHKVLTYKFRNFTYRSLLQIFWQIVWTYTQLE